MKLEILIKEFRDAIKGSEELEPSALANLNAAIDTAERRIVRKNPLAESPLTPSGGTEESEIEDDVIANVKTAGEVIAGLSLSAVDVAALNTIVKVDRKCLDCGVELANDLFERCGSCLDARM